MFPPQSSHVRSLFFSSTYLSKISEDFVTQFNCVYVFMEFYACTAFCGWDSDLLVLEAHQAVHLRVESCKTLSMWRTTRSLIMPFRRQSYAVKQCFASASNLCCVLFPTWKRRSLSNQVRTGETNVVCWGIFGKSKMGVFCKHWPESISQLTGQNLRTARSWQVSWRFYKFRAFSKGQRGFIMGPTSDLLDCCRAEKDPLLDHL